MLYALVFTIYTRLMKNVSLGLSVLLSWGFLMVGCGSSSDANPCSGGQVDCDGECVDPFAPTLAAIQSQIFDLRGCALSACHDSDLPQAQLDLSSVTASATNLIDINSVQVPDSLRVAPNDSSASYLMNKLLGVDMALGTTRMPQNDDGFVLCDAEVNAIRQWIDDGAIVP